MPFEARVEMDMGRAGCGGLRYFGRLIGLDSEEMVVSYGLGRWQDRLYQNVYAAMIHANICPFEAWMKMFLNRMCNSYSKRNVNAYRPPT